MVPRKHYREIYSPPLFTAASGVLYYYVPTAEIRDNVLERRSVKSFEFSSINLRLHLPDESSQYARMTDRYMRCTCQTRIQGEGTETLVRTNFLVNCLNFCLNDFYISDFSFWTPLNRIPTTSLVCSRFANSPAIFYYKIE